MQHTEVIKFLLSLSKDLDLLIVTCDINLVITKWTLEEYGSTLLSSSKSSWASHFLDLMSDSGLVQINRFHYCCGNTLDLIFVDNNC